MTGKIIIHCVRHAQGFHNLCEANHAISDPLLTPLGKTQCSTLSTTFPHPENITHIVASPLRRTIYTALYTFPTQVASGIVIEALPEIQETGSLACNTGLSPADLAAEFAAGEGAGKYKDVVDLSRVHEGWNSNIGRWVSTPTAIGDRARIGRQFLLTLGQEALASNPPKVNANGDVEIAVFTHGGFLHYFTDDWEDNGKFTGTGWANTEFRSYEFASTVEEGAALKETPQSREGRRGSEIPLSVEEQRELRAIAMKSWTDSGFQDPENNDVGVEVEARL